MTLVDTSAWSEFFRGRAPASAQVDLLLEANEVAVAGPIFTELMRGIRTPRDRERVSVALEGCRWLQQPADLWRDAGLLGSSLGRRGVTVKTLDLLIATFALAHDVPLLTLDSDFRRLRAAGVPLRLA